MATLTLPRAESWRPRPIAPLWHTALLILLFAALTAGGAWFQGRAHSHPGVMAHRPNVLPIYLSLMVAEWGLFLYVWKGGLRRTGTSLRDLIGGRWSRPRDVAVDLLGAAAMWGVWMGLMLAWQRWVAPDHAVSIDSLLPRSALEAILWIGLSVTAGICEEAVFRGYFQVQFHAFTGSAWVAVVLQALLFGVSHGYQGVEASLKIALYGVLFGGVALWRRSLRPGMIAHAWTDIASGLLLR